METPSPEYLPVPQVEAAPPPEGEKKQTTIITIVVIVIILLLALLVAAVIYLLQPGTPTDRIRDIFLIFLALESIVIGAALIVVIVQLATLVNLLQNEVRPILHATNETVNTLRGTAEFLGESVVEPVIKLNGYLAGMQRVLELMRFKKR
jgi:Na+-transporting NADH:ubiquinone oxidoreductase subunit NqrC